MWGKEERTLTTMVLRESFQLIPDSLIFTLDYFQNAYIGYCGKTLTEIYLGRKGFFSLHVTVHFWSKPGQQLKQELRGRNWSRNDVWMLFNSLLTGSHSAPFVYTACIHLLRDGTTHSGLGPPTSAIKRVIHKRHAHRPNWWVHFIYDHFNQPHNQQIE